MKRTFSLILFSLCFAFYASAAEAPASDQLVATTIKEIQVQQALLADNQAKIDAKLATVLEAVRIARIYSSRSGH